MISFATNNVLRKHLPIGFGAPCFSTCSMILLKSPNTGPALSESVLVNSLYFSGMEGVNDLETVMKEKNDRPLGWQDGLGPCYWYNMKGILIFRYTTMAAIF
ncbi:hypothetical protein PIB30_118874 [Stylosanthes scabra]|uniref:Uncharacterized protein n=1 Tax=Stylosanthes scabra TaxID=79078 RepID=A0ABU6S342_9FABA|nr:hypothetical protein [Stylosanthes scabra]